MSFGRTTQVTAIVPRRTESAIDHVSQRCGRIHLVDIFVRDVGKEAREVHLLLIVAANGRRGGLSDDGDNGHVITLCIVQTVRADGAPAPRSLNTRPVGR